MKKIGCILTAVIEIAALAGAYIIHYYTERKLGMIRYVNFKNMTWEREYPIEILKTSCVVVILTLTIATLFVPEKKTGVDQMDKSNECRPGYFYRFVCRIQFFLFCGIDGQIITLSVVCFC